MSTLEFRRFCWLVLRICLYPPTLRRDRGIPTRGTRSIIYESVIGFLIRIGLYCTLVSWKMVLCRSCVSGLYERAMGGS
jgi:hypothetical protein